MTVATNEGEDAPRSGGSNLGGWRVEILLALFVLSVVGPLMHPYADQQASRYAFTAALWDNRTVRLDGLEHAVGRDAASREGHLYSDKAPLQPLLAVPFYAVYRSVGGESAATVRTESNLGLWWQSFWLAAVPLAILSLLLLRLSSRIDRKIALPVAASVVFGTILLPFGGMLFGHALATLFLVAAAYLLYDGQPSAGRLFSSGLLAGASVATEYPIVLAVIVLAVFVVWKVRWRSYWFVLGGLPAALLLAVYHTIAFGSPLSHPYRYNVFSGVVAEQKELLSEFSGPQFGNLVKIFFGGRGFLIASPVVIVGLIGLAMLIRHRRGNERAFALMALGAFLALLAIPLFWGNPWGGFSPGPRYVTAALPLLVVGVVAAWPVRPMLTRFAVGLSVLAMVLAVLTNPLVDGYGPGGLGTWIGLAVEGDFVETVFTMSLGPWGWLVHGAVVAAAGYLLHLAWRRDGSRQSLPQDSAII